jgi:hypothetical protein
MNNPKPLRKLGEGPLSAASISDEVTCMPAKVAVVDLNVTQITTPDGDDEIDFYIQTTFDGIDWVDRAQVHFATANNGQTARRLVLFGQPASDADIVTPTDGAIADNTDANVPLGLKVRIKVVLTGATAPSYNYNAYVFFRQEY